MRLAVQLVCTLCALAAAVSEQPPQAAPSGHQLQGILRNLYRRFLHTVAPKELAIQDALDIDLFRGKVGGHFTSPARVRFEGSDQEVPAFMYNYGLLHAGDKGPAEGAHWVWYDTMDQLQIYHYGGSVKVHMISADGIHKEAILGNPLYHKDHNATFVVMVPHGNYITYESLSEEKSTIFTVVTILAAVTVPRPIQDNFFTHKQMEAKFPAHSELFQELDNPGVHHEPGYDENRFDSHEDEENGEGRQGRRFRGRFRALKKFFKH